MESEKILTPTELTELYVQYKDALVGVDLAEMVREQGRKDAEVWVGDANKAMADAVSDVDALEINAYLASTMIADRYAIVKRLRAQDRPVPWSRIGKILGMSKQAAQQWYDTYNLRSPIENPTNPIGLA